MVLTVQDVREGYRVVLGREPEDDAVIATHLLHGDKATLLKALLDSDESSGRNGLLKLEKPAEPTHQHHIFKGYIASDLDVLYKFQNYLAPHHKGFVTNFLGIRYRVGFAPGLTGLDGRVEGYPQPAGSHQGETAEFVGTLRSVLDASSGCFRMLECGAGYGTWMANSYAAACQKGIADIHVVGVEADKGHFDFLLQHMADNNITCYTAILGAVGSAAGVAEWAITEDPAADYGGGLHRKGSAVVTIEVFELAAILRREPYWDLVHIDIQGGEAALCRMCIDVLGENVRRVVIGTHSRAIDGEIMSIFFHAGWALENEKPTIYDWDQDAASLEEMAQVDGVQVWRNPKLLP